MKLPLLVAFVSVSMAFAPARSAHADIFAPSVKDQIKLGQQAAADLRKKEKVLPANDLRVQTLRRLAARILRTFPKNEPWQYSFDVLDSKEVNAFALPGGPTFFYTGLLNKLSTEDELAGIIGHELTHVRQQHWARGYAKSQKRNLLLTGILILAHANRNIADIASLGNSLYSLKFSRADETAADIGGFNASSAAGFNPQGMADAFTLLDKLGGSHNPEFVSDHPSNGHRISLIEARIKDSNKSFRPQRKLPWPIEPLKK